jgi:hypothetical protein
MNLSKEVLELNLKEALDELGFLRSRLNDPQCDEDEVASRLSGVFWHLRAAWNGRSFTLDDISRLSVSDFDKLGSTPVVLPGTPPI